MKLILSQPGVRALVTFFTLYFAFIGIYAPYFTLYLDVRGFSAAEIGLLMSALQALRIIGPYLWGWVADHTGQPTRVMRVTLVVATLSFMPIFSIPSWWGMLWLMAGLTLFSSGQVPLSEVLARQVLAEHYDQYGRLRLFGSLGFILAVWALGPLLDHLGLSTLPWWMMACLLLLVCTNLTLPNPQVHHADPQPIACWPLFRQPAVLWFVVSAICMIAAHSCLYIYFSLYLYDLGFSKSAIGGLWGLGVVAEVMLFYSQHRLLAKWSAYTMLRTCFFACALRYGVVAYLGATFAGQGRWTFSMTSWLMFSQLLHALTFALHHTLTIRQIQHWFSGRAAARGQALYASLAYGLGGTLGGMLCTILWTNVSHPAVFSGSALLALCGCYALYLSHQRQKRDAF